MSDCNEITRVLLRGGTDQLDRSKNKLDPASIQLHGFGLSDWMEFAYNFATDHVNYFSTDTNSVDGNWQNFFKDPDETEKLLEDLENSDELTPHLTLFICFLRLLEYSSTRLNAVTKRHLDFYYQDVLQISHLPAQYDKVNLLFELSKNLSLAKLSKGTLLNGGKDANGNILMYEISEEASLNEAKIDDLRNFYFDPNIIDETTGSIFSPSYMKSSLVPKTTDGIKEPLPEENPSWYGFGYHHDRVGAPFTELSNAKIGFAVSSKALALSEGTRYIEFEIKFSEAIDAITFNELQTSIGVSFTGEFGWVKSNPLLLNAEATNVAATGQQYKYNTVANTFSKSIKLLVALDSGVEGSFSYNPEFHDGIYDTQNPIFKFIVNTNTQAGLKVYRNFIKKITSINISVGVREMRAITLDSDTGLLNPKKPMYPFTQTPVTGSNLTIFNQELFNKKWTKATVSVKWKNKPSNIYDWYSAYRESQVSNITRNGYSSSLTTSARIVKSNNHFTVKRHVKVDGDWFTQNAPSTSLLFGTQDEGVFTFDGTLYSSKQSQGLRISLVNSFLHDLFPVIYTIALSSDSPTLNIPNKPYTPFAEEVLLSYDAIDVIQINSGSLEAFNSRENAFFHEHPYGQSIQNVFLKSQLDFVTTNQCTLAPDYCRGGEMYIAIKDADHLQNVSLLVQVSEGTENKEIATFTGGQKVEWSILCSDNWKSLDSTLLTKNEIDNFLQSGIVQFKIPNEATLENNILPSGKFWIKAKMHKPFDAVCRILDIKAQVARAVFVNNNNDLAHLAKGLPSGTIKKLIERSSKVKKVDQPFNSYDGKPIENDENYYRRVSERLRHKNRAITLWDYEHLTLEEFNDLYKVKCLNHTNDSSYTAAGSVTLVVIPDTVGKNVYNLYQPRVSTAQLNKIKAFISKYTTLHVNLEVINPDYEEITVKLKVKFQVGLDEAVHIIQLNEDITRLLSPWAFDETKQVDFGHTLHRSILINYIENLSYVDYVQDVKMIVDGGSSIDNYTPKSPKSIMVSAVTHEISTEIITCEPITQIITEQCQH
ncbi:MAG: hypothetical protein ACJASQ_003024 [Crocinitomicaceae bacterium]|jgi:hypothetical protein